MRHRKVQRKCRKSAIFSPLGSVTTSVRVTAPTASARIPYTAAATAMAGSTAQRSGSTRQKRP